MSNFSGATEVGVDAVDPAASLRAGQLVANSADGIVPANLNNVIGVSKFDHTQYGKAVIINEAVILNGTTPSNLSRANVSNVAVRLSEDLAATPESEGSAAEYSLNATNGTIARTGSSSNIGDGDTVYVTFTYDLVASDFDFDGLPFHYQFGNNYSATQEDRIVVIKGPHELFTTEWDTSRAYGLTGTASNLFCDANGRFSADDAAGAADYVGKVFQLPTSGDSYLGILVNGTPVQQTP
jgi:hypothetical protein